MALGQVLWEQVFAGLTVEDAARLAGTSYTHLQVVGGFEWLQEAHADFWRLIDWIADVQEWEYNERNDAESDASIGSSSDR